MVAKGFTVDLDKALVFQVGHLEETYHEWVHQPIVSKEGPRFFENNVLEFLTRTVWWAVPVIWLPVVCWLATMSMQMGHSLPQVSVLMLSGISLWTFVEYTLHRFLFHIETKSYWTNTVHYLLHGCHHKHPMDGLRLVFPPAATAILSVLFYNLIKLMSTPSTAPAVFGGGLLGYVLYDCTHYYLHHGQPSRDPARNLKDTVLIILCATEVSLESSLQGSDQGLWDYFSIVGQCVWDFTTSTEVCCKEQLIFYVP